MPRRARRTPSSPAAGGAHGASERELRHCSGRHHALRRFPPGATLAQVLLLGNSDEIENKLADGNGRIVRAEKEKVPPETLVDDLYLAAFSRRPTSDERTTALDYLQSAADKRKGAEDLLWTLLNSREFSFNH